jgi:hypothetical protein
LSERRHGSDNFAELREFGADMLAVRGSYLLSHAFRRGKETVDIFAGQGGRKLYTLLYTLP